MLGDNTFADNFQAGDQEPNAQYGMTQKHPDRSGTPVSYRSFRAGGGLWFEDWKRGNIPTASMAGSMSF